MGSTIAWQTIGLTVTPSPMILKTGISWSQAATRLGYGSWPTEMVPAMVTSSGHWATAEAFSWRAAFREMLGFHISMTLPFKATASSPCLTTAITESRNRAATAGGRLGSWTRQI